VALEQERVEEISVCCNEKERKGKIEDPSGRDFSEI
jgi:hypothetical protein